MSTTSSSTVTTDRSSVTDPSIGLPATGHVSRLRSNWLVYEDGALAHKLQTEEITTHLSDNRRKNVQIRDDFPRALEEQTREQDQVQRWIEDRRRQLREQEKIDAEVARRVAMEMTDDQRRYEADRDRAFVERLQRTTTSGQQSRQQHQMQQQQQQHRHPIVPQPRGVDVRGVAGNHHFSSPSPSTTPPLPVMSNGDVPTASSHSKSNATPDFDDVLPHVRGGVRYNDEQYLIKLARPAVVTAEPVYANNRPEHYAVSAKFPQPLSDTGAIAKTPRPLGPGLPDTPKASEMLLGAIGLSQRDLALSKRAEEQLEQERRDQELAKRLQEELNMEQEPESEDARLAREEQDREFAEMLQAKEKAKLQRAKERAKLKKQQQRQQQQQQQQQQQLHEGGEVEQLPGELQQVSHHHHHHHERALSQPVSLNVSGGGGQISGASRAESRQSRRSDGGMASAGALPNGRHSRTSANSRSFEEDVRPPARRPYMNPGAIDLHRSEFAVHHPSDVADDEDEDDEDEYEEDNDVEKELEEPQYANVGPAAAQALREELLRESRLSYVHHGDSPIPPYMPLQQPVTRKSTSLEKRIKKKKEKEGCKQQ